MNRDELMSKIQETGFAVFAGGILRIACNARRSAAEPTVRG